MDDRKIIIRTCFRNEFRFIVMDSETLSSENFMNAVQIKYRINGDLRVKATLTDNYNTPIASENFCSIIHNFKNSGSFFIHVQFSIIEQNPAQLTKDNLEQYLNVNGGGLLLKENRENGALTDKSRKQLIQKCTRFMVDVFGERPSKNQRSMLARTIVELFPFLSMDILVNPNGGYLDNALKRYHSDLKKIRAHDGPSGDQTVQLHINEVDLNSNATNLESATAALSINSDSIEQADIWFLKSAVCNEENLDSIKEKLSGTIQYRSKLLKEPTVDLLVEFPYFFKCPDLILYDFEIRYPDVHRLAFPEFWKAHNNDLHGILSRFYPTYQFTTAWPEEIQNMFVLLRLFPTKNSSSSTVFSKAMEKLLIFKTIGCSPKQLIDATNKYPHIVALGYSYEQIIHYYIVIEKELIDVPPTYDFSEVIDLFYKVHVVFDIDFEPNVAPTMNFLQHYIYKKIDRKHPPSNRMKEVFLKLGLTDSNNC